MPTRMHAHLQSLFVLLGVAWLPLSTLAQGCDQKQACDAVRNCELQVSTKDCEPHWNCEGLGKPFCEIDKGRFKAQCEAEKAAQNKGYEVAKASCEAQKAAEKAACEATKSANRLGCEAQPTFDKVSKGIDHFGKEFEKALCDTFTLGAYSRGEAGCGVNAGVGHDKQGFYTYNPSDPDTKYRPGQGPSEKPSAPNAKELEHLARIIQNTPPFHYEYDFKDAFGVDRFLPADYKFGAAWPDSAGPISAPTRDGIVRGKDKEGGGNFLALRGDPRDGTLRFHGGVDYLAMPGERIFAPVSGEIVRPKNPGKRGLTGLEIKTPGGYTSSIFYIAPTMAIQQALAVPVERRSPEQVKNLRVESGKTTIGYAQDLTLPFRYGSEITNHVHVTLQDASGKYISPAEPNVAIRPSSKGKLTKEK